MHGSAVQIWLHIACSSLQRHSEGEGGNCEDAVLAAPAARTRDNRPRQHHDELVGTDRVGEGGLQG